ncbi:GerMN domain-containing protein [Clostridiaceae bacterium M8S5]|nr:GerMN domain-containing protein [Clostridiaceae bacterium M8S5]
MYKKILIIACMLTFILAGCGKEFYKNEDEKQWPIIEPYAYNLNSNISLYFANKTEDRLSVEKRVVKSDKNTLKNVIINELLTGPVSKDRVDIIPNDVKIISILEKDGIIYLNLSKTIKELDINEQKEALILYSLVNTICDYRSNIGIQILVEGKRCDKFIKYYSIKDTITTSELILKKYQSPISLIRTYCDYIVNKDYSSAARMRNSYQESGDIKEIIYEIKSQFNNISTINIKEYTIDKYDKKIEILLVLELLDEDQMGYMYNYKCTIEMKNGKFIMNDIYRV